MRLHADMQEVKRTGTNAVIDLGSGLGNWTSHRWILVRSIHRPAFKCVCRRPREGMPQPSLQPRRITPEYPGYYYNAPVAWATHALT